jgi:hypothetical protein
VFHTLAPRFR